jgi:hypothetical protein
MTRQSLKVCLIGLALLWPAVSFGKTTILEGQHRVVLDIINPTGVRFIPDYKNAGFTQRVLETKRYAARVEILIDLAPFNSREPFPVSLNRIPQSEREFLNLDHISKAEQYEFESLASQLAGGSATEAKAFERISRWVADNVTYRIDTPQDAVSVLNNRAGSCAGQTRLMMALLRSVGIPARYSRGFLPPGGRWGFEKQYWGVNIMSGGYHAWVEVYFPDQGWVFSDILHSLYFVDPYHLLFHISGTDLNPAYELATTGEEGNIEIEKGTSFTIFEEHDQSVVKDAIARPERNILSRRTGPQTSCAIYGRVFDQSGEPVNEGRFIFWKGTAGESHPLGKAGRFGMAGFPPGEYSFSVRAEGFSEATKKVGFTGVGAKEINFTLEPGGSIQGRVTDRFGRPVRDAKVVFWKGIRGLIYRADNDGRYEIIGCPVGSFKVSVEAEGFMKQESEVQIEPGEKVQKDFMLHPQ